MIFDLVKDFADVLDSMPQGHPRRRILNLLEEAIRRDVHFIDRHPTTFFQCMWNTCWWYDCPDALKHYVDEREGESTEHSVEGPLIFQMLEDWRERKSRDTPGFKWVRLLRPPREHLGTSLRSLFRGHDEDVNSVAFFPDSRRIASCGDDGTIRTWNIETCQQLSSWKLSSSYLRDLDVSPDGATIAVAGDEGFWIIGSLSGEQCLRLPWSGKTVSCVRWSPDGNSLAVGVDKDILLIDFLTGKQLHKLQGHCDLVGSLAFSPDGALLASGARGLMDQSMRVWCIRSGSERLLIGGFEGTVNDVAFSNDGVWLAGCSSDRSVRVWDIIQEVETLVIKDYAYPLKSLAFVSPTEIATGEGLNNIHRDIHIRFLNIQNGLEQQSLAGHSAMVNSLRCSPDGRWLASASDDGTVRTWSTSHESFTRRIKVSLPIPVQMSAPMSQRLVTIAEHQGCEVLYIWDLPNGVVERQVELESSLSDVVLTTDGRIVAGSGEKLWIWDLSQSREITTKNDYGRIFSPSYAPQKGVLAAAAWDCVILFDLATGEQIRRIDLPEDYYLDSLTLSPDGQSIVIRHGIEMALWDVITGKQIYNWPDVYGGPCAFSPDSRWIVTTGLETLWVFDTQREIADREIPLRDNYTQAAFFADGVRVAVSGRFGTTSEIWDIKEEQCLDRIEGHMSLESWSENTNNNWGLTQDTESLFWDVIKRKTSAWFPVPLRRLTGVPNDSLWFGWFDDHLWIMKLECDSYRNGSV
jgi:WD40 repeat protein